MLIKNNVLVCCHCGVFILSYFLMFVNLHERKEYLTSSQDLVIITFVTSAMIALLLRASMSCLPVSKKPGVSITRTLIPSIYVSSSLIVLVMAKRQCKTPLSSIAKGRNGIQGELVETDIMLTVHSQANR